MYETKHKMQVVETRQVTKAERMRVWSEFQLAAKEKRTRPFYRAVDRRGLMYAGKLNTFKFWCVFFHTILLPLRINLLI